ncbi:hypothetical protein NECAME_09361 [Necator americanus]|uniref:Calponin-homology (CH) domain-containing protein n=1 Tax=Necator americanus TaxID=51031 RepID=W2TG41_NECAM|nr:hypothetical protein NECAME_09361 [Necator americanus]ETN80161.1 hypothetical protein NECAME_09361 [Necator americanus]
MSEEQKIVQEIVEEQAPALPSSEPPTEDVGKPPESEVTEEPKAEEKPTEEAAKEEKPASRIFKRPTLKWGKKRDEPAAPKEPEQAKDIREDALGWIAQQIPPAVHKVNFYVLDWAQKLAYDESERPALPGKDCSMTRNQFLSHLRDGKLLAALANKLQPGAVDIEPEVAVKEPAALTESVPAAEGEKPTETPAEPEASKDEEGKGEPAVEPAKPEEKPAPTEKTPKEKQAELVGKFASWAKESLGLDEGKVSQELYVSSLQNFFRRFAVDLDKQQLAMTAADLLEKGKAGYPAVFETLWQLALKAQEKFQQEGIDVDAVLAAASQVVRTNIIQSFLNFFRRRPAPATEKKDEPVQPPAGGGDAAPNAPEGEQVVEEECKKANLLPTTCRLRFSELFPFSLVVLPSFSSVIVPL